MGQLTNKFNYAWYGTCDEHDSNGCKSYIFADHIINLKSSVELISTYNTGTLNTTEFFRPSDESGTLKSLECGAMYNVVLKTGKKFNLPGLTPAGLDTINYGENQLPAKISFACENVYEPTPTPTPFDCIPTTGGYTSVSITSNTSVDVMINGSFHTFSSFEVGDVVGLDMSFFRSTLAGYIVIEFPQLGDKTSVITLTGLEPKENGGDLYVQRGDSCFRGSYVKDKSIYRVTMQLINGNLPNPPTPTPVKPTPTPVELPSPTPVAPTPTPIQPTPTPVSEECCNNTHTVILTNGTGTEKIENKSVNGNVQMVFGHRGFEEGGTLCVNLDTTNGSTDIMAKTIPVHLESKNNPAIGTVKKTLVNQDNSLRYIDSKNQCWSGTIDTSATELILSAGPNAEPFDSDFEEAPGGY